MSESQSERLARAHASIERRGGAPCEIALVLGSGLGQLADAVKQPTIIPYGEIDGFPVSTAPGHKGQFVIGSLLMAWNLWMTVKSGEPEAVAARPALQPAE